jgi:hypothetical protein
MSKLAEEVLTNAEHLKHTIITLSRQDVPEERLKPYREQLIIVQGLDM